MAEKKQNHVFAKNELYPLTITSVTSEGSGVGHLDGGFAVFVPDTAPGDEIEVRLVKVLSSYAFGIVERMISPSEDRIADDCAVGKQCGGCCFRHIGYEAECRVKSRTVEDCMRRIGGFDLSPQPILGAESTAEYRNKAQFPVGYDKNGQLVCGFYAGRSHRIISLIEHPCRIQPEEFTQIAEAVLKWMRRNRVSAYNETTRKGNIRHIYLRKGEKTGEVMLTLVGAHAVCEAKHALISDITTQFPQVSSILYSHNPHPTNVILGKDCVTLYGAGYIRDILCGVEVRISPMAFYQVNHAQTERLYRLAAVYADLKENDLLLDLYCGIGTIGLSMAKEHAVGKLIGVEVVPQAIADAKVNASVNGIDAQFICDDASGMAKRFEAEGLRPDVVVLDPPRKGCDEAGLLAVAQMEPKRIVMVSCNPSTAARDCKVLCEQGYQLVEYTPVDLFPRTAHVETVIHLSQQKPDDRIEVDLDLDELDITAAESKATYEEIKAYVKEQTGLAVSALYIAQVKRKLGFEMGENHNPSHAENQKIPHCPPEKEAAIADALRHFGMLAE